MKFQKYIKRFPTLAILFAMLIGGSLFLSSCKEDDENKTSEVVLHSFGPTGAKHGEKIKFIGLNLDKVSAIQLPEAEINRSEFVTQTSELIELVVPDAAEAGKVFLVTPNGKIETKTMLNFLVPVEIQSITAEAKPGTNISIKGKLVSWIEEVVFDEGLSVTEFVSKSLDEVVVAVPMEAKTGFLIFKTGGTDPLTFASAEKLVVSIPTIESLSPVSIKHTENLTIKGTNLDLVKSVIFASGDTITSFGTQTETEIVVAVPSTATKGKLTLTQISPVTVTSRDELTIILPVGTALSPKPAKPGTDNLTITGTDLDLIASLTLPGISTPIPASSFITHNATTIVLALPEGAAAGGVKYTTIHGYSNNLGVTIVLPGAGPAPLPISLYDETMAPGGGDWSWNKVISDPASTEQFYSGKVSWKFETDNGGGLSSGGITAVDASGQEAFIFSLYGGPGTDGADVAAILNDNWGNYNSVKLVEGKWTTYQIKLSAYPGVDKTKIVRYAFKVEGKSASVIYADRVGFGAAGPDPLPVSLFDEKIEGNGGDWSWDKLVSDPANAEQAYSGKVSWKFETDNTGGLSAGGITPVDASGKTYFTFSVYGGPGTNNLDLAAILNDKWDSYNSVKVVEGKWTTYKIELSKYATVDASAIVRFALKVEAKSSLIYVDRVGFE